VYLVICSPEASAPPAQNLDFGAWCLIYLFYMLENDQLVNLLKENLEYSRQILASAKKTERYMLWHQICHWAKFIIIAIPIILALIYLPPLINRAIEQYSSLSEKFDNVGGTGQIKLDENALKQFLK
jgi:hypothetical protein